MAFAAWQATIVNAAGDVQPNAAIEVLREVAGQPPAQCYSDRAGATPIGSTFNADADGFVRFFVAGGAYQITATSGAFSRVWRYQAIGTSAETDAFSIPTSVSTGWRFNSPTTDSDPGSGIFQLNHATPSSATEIYLDNENEGGNSVTAWLDSLDDAGNASNRGQLHVCDPDQPTEVFRVYTVSGSVVDGTGYRKVTVAHVAGAGSFTVATLHSFTFSQRGPQGEQGIQGIQGEQGIQGIQGEQGDPGEVTSAGSSVAGQLSAFTDTSGDEIEGANLGDSPPTPVIVGSDAGIRAATPGHAVHAGHLETASALVSLTETGGSIAVDWDAFINGTVTIDENSTLANPTNGQPGTWRTIYIVGNDGTNRTLAFGNQYLGDLPTLTDIDSGLAYLLMIFCVTTTHFVVSAKEAT